MVLLFSNIVPLDHEDYFLMKEMLKYCSHPADAVITASMKKTPIEFILSEDGKFDGVPGIKRRWQNK